MHNFHPPHAEGKCTHGNNRCQNRPYVQRTNMKCVHSARTNAQLPFASSRGQKRHMRTHSKENCKNRWHVQHYALAWNELMHNYVPPTSRTQLLFTFFFDIHQDSISDNAFWNKWSGVTILLRMGGQGPPTPIHSSNLTPYPITHGKYPKRLFFHFSTRSPLVDSWLVDSWTDWLTDGQSLL